MSTETRALTAALSSPAFVTRGGGAAIHAANRHVERWAPEAEASRTRPLRSLGFVDRLVSPWIEAAQRSASLRMFSQYVATGAPERNVTSNASWVFPRPWYQDELDWMAAARQVGTQTAAAQAAAPNLLTTRGTYVAPAQPPQSQIALPTTLHEYIAPSLSVTRPDLAMTGETFSPLVPFAATQAAYVMARAVAPLGVQGQAAQMSPGLRAVLTSMLARATHSRGDVAPTRASMSAPEMVTPPAPRPGMPPESALQLAEQYAEQHAHIAELQRMARAAAEREHARREAAPPSPTATSSTAAEAKLAEIRAAQARVVEQRRRDDAARQQEALRLHEQSREAAARDARSEPLAPSPEPRAQHVEPESRVALELAAAVAALPPELASLVTAGISRRPERAAQSIAELGEALRSVELIARTSAAGGSFAPTRGPRVVMPAGLGGLVSTVEHTMASERATGRMPAFAPITAAAARTPALAFLGPRGATTSALGAATSATPAGLTHVAWSDRWLARFAGANPSSLDVLAAAASPETRMQLLASAAPHAVFVSPVADDEVGATAFSGTRTQDVLPTLRGGPAPAQPVIRFDDDAETPDDMFAAIAMSASRARAGATATAVAPPSKPPVEPERHQPRDTLADLVAHAAPSAPGAGLSAQLASSPFAPALRHVLPLGSAPAFDVRALFGAGLSATYLAGLVSASTNELAIASWGESPALDLATRSALEFEPTYVTPELPLTTLRSALLSWDAESVGATTQPGALARTMVDSLALPMLGDSAAAYDAFGEVTHATTYAAPGMIADRAHAWSVAQERSSSDLAFDFVSPELVLAARVYGLGPAEAAQAARLAVAGPGQLTAMAGAVDRTFVQAMAIELDRRGERMRAVSAYPIAVEAGAGSARDAQAYAAGSGQDERAGFATSGSTFGVERRAPRGAFLWPAGTTAALGLSAPRPDSEQSTSVAALELLAARAVAELGTFTALSDIERAGGAIAGTTSTGALAEPRDEDVLATAGTLVPAGRRDKFEALYVALGQSPAGRTWSPAARAARAVALAARGGEAISARERATIAWDVLPVVHGSADAADDGSPLSTGEAAARTARREELRFDPSFVDLRPGLGALSARAGEALGSYVTPTVTTGSTGASSTPAREPGALLRAPTAAPELVQTGRPAGRHGGGEVEIPAWFEAAARKMFEQKASVSDGISLAELTLVTAAPAPQIAASSRTASAPASIAPASAAAAGAQKPQQVDIEKLANDVYREVLVLMDIARARNGEPYL